MISYERELFTAMFWWPEEIAQTVSSLRSDHFEQDDWRKLFEAMHCVYDAGAAIDTTHVLEKLIGNGMREEDAGQLMARTLDGMPVRTNITRYIFKIREKAKYRRIIALMENTKLRAETGDVTDLETETLQGIWAIQDDMPCEAARESNEVARELVEQAFNERSSAEEIVGIPFGLQGLDIKTTGIRLGELWIVGALPGRGKTAFGLQAAMQAASKGMPTLIFSLEMSRTELLRRMVGAEIGTWDCRNPRGMSEQNWGRFTEQAAEIGTWPLYIDDSATLTPIDIAARARVQIRQRGIKLIVVDYLQLIRGAGRELRERVGAAANALRELAKQTGVPVIALSQLRRPSDLNDRPSMIDLKESGDIEAHAHSVLLLYMPLGENDMPTGEDEIIIGKQRNGPIGAIPVYFDKRTLQFRSRMAV